MSPEEVFGCNAFEYLLSLPTRLLWHPVDDIIYDRPQSLQFGLLESRSWFLVREYRQ
jgi:hypothetical protein